MLAHILAQAAAELLSAAVPAHAPTGSLRIRSRAELPAALARLAAAKPLPRP